MDNQPNQQNTPQPGGPVPAPSSDAPWLKPVEQKPKPAAPATPPPVPPKPPTTPPPAPVQASAPSPKPQTESSGLWWKLLVGLAILLALGVLGYSLYQGWTAKPTASVTPPTNTGAYPPLGNGETSSTTGGASSTTPGTPAQNNYGFSTEDTYPFGQPTSLFANDNILFKDATHALGVKVLEFTDSRCQPNVQCIWAGEQGVRLEVTNELTGQTQEVDLGMVRAKTGAAFGATFVLNEIDEGKGGTYASITVN